MSNHIFSALSAVFLQSSQAKTTAICPISVLVTKTAEHSLSNIDHKAELKMALNNFADSLGVTLPLYTMINSVEREGDFATYKINFSGLAAAREFYNEIVVNSEPAHVYADEITLDGREVIMRAAGEQGKALEAIMKAHSQFAKQVHSH